jgi:hypothetical protein
MECLDSDENCGDAFLEERVSVSFEAGRLNLMRFALRDGAIIEELPDGAVLFSEAGQEVQQLNATSALLARRLSGSATRAELEGELVRHGADALQARGWVEAFLSEISQLNLLRVEKRQAPQREWVRTISVAGVGFMVSFSSRELFDLLWPPFAHLEAEGSRIGAAYDVSAAGDLVAIQESGGEIVLLPQSLAAIRLKGTILEQVLAKAEYLAALHAACVTRGDETLVLIGSPGAGKTTLLLSLLAQGFGYVCDDVTLVLKNGRVAGVPLPPALKSGSWKLGVVDPEQVEALPVHTRPDGIVARLLPMTSQRADERKVTAIVRLRRSAGEEARLTALSSSEGLAELFREARSPSGRCSAETFHALAELVRGASAVELRYGESTDAADVLAERSQWPTIPPSPSS